MSSPQVGQLSHYDVLWLSPHPFDAMLSGMGRLLRSRSQGLRTLVVTAFSGEHNTDAEPALTRLGADHLSLGLDAARRRDRSYVSFTTRAFAGHESDAACLETLRRLAEDLGHRTKARDVYAPLGVGGNVDHRLLHEASARAFPVGPGQNLFFYEDRPYAFVPGAVRLRLGQLAVRLPPASVDIGDRASLASHVWGFMTAAIVRASMAGLRERARCLWCAALAWRRARGWQPRKAFGLRLQPVVDDVDAALAREVHEELSALGPATTRLAGSAASQMRHAASYARRLKRKALVERYWLRLPPLEHDGVTTLTDSEMPLP